MRAYRVQLFKNGQPYLRIAASQAEARLAGKELCELHMAKRGEIEVAEIEIPVGKAGLLPWLNELLQEVLNG